VGLLYFIQQQNRIWAALDLFSQLAALFVAYVAGRAADQHGDEADDGRKHQKHSSGAVDATAIVVLRRYGMEPDRDYQFVELRFPAMLPALESKRADAVFLT